MDFDVTQWSGTTEQLLAYLDRGAAVPQSKQRTCFTDWHEWRNYIIYSLSPTRPYRIPPKVFLSHHGRDFAGLMLLVNYARDPQDTFHITFVCSTLKGAAESLISHAKTTPGVNVLTLDALYGTQRFYVKQGFKFKNYMDDPKILRGESQSEEMIWKKDEGYVADTEGGRKRRRKTRRRHK